MRTLRFRAWDKTGKRMSTDVIRCLEYDSNLKVSLNDLLKTSDFIIMQYTGLKDKSGKEIYEGDIDSRGFVVEYLLGMSGYYLMKNGEGFHLSHEQTVLNGKIKHIEIIGNRYQNPELLKGGK